MKKHASSLILLPLLLLAWGEWGTGHLMDARAPAPSRYCLPYDTVWQDGAILQISSYSITLAVAQPLWSQRRALVETQRGGEIVLPSGCR